MAMEWVSVNDVLGGRLPAAAAGVYWADTNWTECRPHLEHPSWAPARSDAKVGLVLTGRDPDCDACAEARREKGR